MDKYKIIRMYSNGKKRTMRRGLTLEEAKAHCSNPETSSKTCSTRTKSSVEWFDGFEKEQL